MCCSYDEVFFHYFFFFFLRPWTIFSRKEHCCCPLIRSNESAWAPTSSQITMKQLNKTCDARASFDITEKILNCNIKTYENSWFGLISVFGWIPTPNCIFIWHVFPFARFEKCSRNCEETDKIVNAFLYLKSERSILTEFRKIVCHRFCVSNARSFNFAKMTMNH